MTDRTLTLVTLHGDTDLEGVRQRHRDNQILTVPRPEDRTDMPQCEVVAVYRDDGGSRLELHFGDWKDVPALKEGDQVVLTHKPA